MIGWNLCFFAMEFSNFELISVDCVWPTFSESTLSSQLFQVNCFKSTSLSRLFQVENSSRIFTKYHQIRLREPLIGTPNPLVKQYTALENSACLFGLKLEFYIKKKENCSIKLSSKWELIGPTTMINWNFCTRSVCVCVKWFPDTCRTRSRFIKLLFVQ